MLGSIDSIVTDIGAKSLDALWMRSNAISDNIANEDTPGYSAKSVSFEDQLSSALSGGSITESELSGINPVESQDQGTYGADGNGVDIEQQMVALTQNQLQYSYMERAVSDNLGLLMTAAKEGR
jgi:flagellar basal-body rod protein FlgB